MCQTMYEAQRMQKGTNQAKLPGLMMLTFQWLLRIAIIK